MVMNKPCFRELEEMIEARQDEFLIPGFDNPKRILTAFPTMDRAIYYHCVEDVIKEAVEKYSGIKIEDVFDDDYDFPFLSDLCFFVKAILASFQTCGAEIVWFIDPNVKDMVVEKKQDGSIDNIITGEDPNYQMVFKVLMFELKQECYRMEGYNLDTQGLKKIKINKEESKND